MCCLQQFLYPSEEDMYKLVRFLVEKLPESSEGGKSLGGNDISVKEKLKENDLPGTSNHRMEKADDQGMDMQFPQLGARMKSEVQESWDVEAENEDGTRVYADSFIHKKVKGVVVSHVSMPATQDLREEELNSLRNGSDSVEKSNDSRRGASTNQEMSTQRDDKNALTSAQEQSLKVSFVYCNVNL